METDFKQVTLSAKITIDDSQYLLIHIKSPKQPESHRRFKNNNDANQWEGILTKLQSRKDVLPKSVMLGLPLVPNATQPNQFAIQQVQLNPLNEETIFYTQNELDQNALKKEFTKSKLDDEEKAELGIPV